MDLASELTGVMCATVTPFEDDGWTVDWAGVRDNAKWLIGAGVRVIVVNGSIGEYGLMAVEDRTRAVRETVGAVAGRAVVIAGCHDPSPRRAVELSQRAIEDGADGVMLMAPSHARASEHDIRTALDFVVSHADAAFLLYNNPAQAGLNIPLETIERLAEHPRFLGLKEASPDVLRYYDIERRFGQSFPVIAANESSLFFMLATGSSGCMTASAAFAPKVLEHLLAAFDAGDLARARSVFDRIHAFRRLLQPQLAAGVPAYIPYTKAAMDCVGLRGGRPHFPMASLADDEKERLRVVLRDELELSVDGATG